MRFSREVLALYVRIWKTYFSWARTLLPLAVIVFVPLGLVHAIPAQAELSSLDFEGILKILGLAIAIIALSATGLIGEVFYTGAVAIALTHPHDGRAPTLREVARTVSYGRLIAIDLIYWAAFALGSVALLVPGFLVFVYLGLSAPAAEIEGIGVRAAFRRSFRLVKGHFWLVAAVLVPVEVLGDAVTDAATALCHSLVGGSLIAEWLTDTASNVILTPFSAVAAVLLTLDLIADSHGNAPRLHRAPPAP
jgi:hypothetical protein